MEKNVFGLISGGKDSIYNIIKCINKGYKLIAVGHLYPQKKTDDKIEIVDDDNKLYLKQNGKNLNASELLYMLQNDTY